MSTTEKLKSKAGTVAETAVEAAKDAAVTAKAKIYEQTEQSKDSVADEVSSVSSALRNASDEMRSGSPQERVVGQFASTLADVSDSIRDQDLGDMMATATDFARRNPLVFLGSAAFLGFAAARYVKASDRSTAYEDHTPTYHSGRTGTYDGGSGT